MSETYIVVYTGGLQPGVELEQAVEVFAGRFGVHPQKVREMLTAGEEVTLKSGLDAREALEYRGILERIGLTVRIEPPLADEPEERGDGGASGDGDDSPVQEPPARELPGETPPSPDRPHVPRRVPARHGWGWLKRGFSMVFAYPVHWIGALLIWTILNIGMNAVPLLNILSALVAAVFMGGVMLGAHEQASGQGFRIERLFAGFTDHLGPLLLVGLLYMLGFIVFALLMLVSIGGVFSLAAPEIWSGPEAPMPPEVLWNPFTWLPVLLMFALVIPLLMAYWFAPVLVMLDDVPPLRAMVLSLRGCAKNILPFIVYGLISIVLFFLGAVPLALGLLIVIPGVVASVYVAYRDIFH